jgi:hypothetical protein
MLNYTILHIHDKKSSSSLHKLHNRYVLWYLSYDNFHTPAEKPARIVSKGFYPISSLAVYKQYREAIKKEESNIAP